MSRSLRDALLQSGATVNGSSALPLHFGAPRAELHAALRLTVLVERSTLGRVVATGPDLLDLLHRLSTQSVRLLEPGQGRPTVLTSPKGRIVERLFVQHLGEHGVLMVGGPSASPAVIEHFNRYTFSERTGLADVTELTCQLALSGPLAGEALATVGCSRPDRYHAVSTTFEGHPLHVLGHDGLTGDGFSFVMAAEHGGSLWQALVLAVSRLDGRPAGEQAVDAARILRGIPAPGRELTADYNPLEAGLWDAVSFDKGCYVGQEVVARLNTYDKVARALVGLELARKSEPPLPGTALLEGERAVGAVTSSTVPPGWERPVALAYVKRRLAQPGAELRLDRPGAPQTARVVKLPFEI